ncbi:hypothetical protein ACJ72_07018, partial [Emergomyces africanus]
SAGEGAISGDTASQNPAENRSESRHNHSTGDGRTVAAWARFVIPHAKPKAGGDGTQGEEPEYKKRKQYLMSNPPPGAIPIAAREKYLDEEKDYVLELIATSPAFERQGHASRLLKWGIEKAERDRARIFLEATPAGLPLYERLGWRVVDTMHVKLGDFGIDAEGDGDGYAQFYVMIRDPQGPKN